MQHGEPVSMKILLVDDDRIDIEHTVRLLKRSELAPTIVSTSSTDEALQLVQQQRFDVILLDYLMPGKDGIEMIMDIKSVELNASAAIILMSNIEEEDVTRQGIQVGAHDFVPKNEITAARLKRAIVQAQTRSQLEKQVAESNKKIRVLAQQDSLTGLTNRHFFEEQLRNSIELAAYGWSKMLREERNCSLESSRRSPRSRRCRSVRWRTISGKPTG